MNVLTRSVRPLARGAAATHARALTAASAAVSPPYESYLHHPSHSVSSDPGRTLPPGYNAKIGHLETFVIPDKITGSEGDRALGRAMINVWRRDGILQVATSPRAQPVQNRAFDASRAFFRKPHYEKRACVDSQSYAGYIASGEEMTDGVADYSEIFTVVKDLPLTDPRVRAKWPCHGPCPWPDVAMKEPVEDYMKHLRIEGEKLLQLTEYGLGVPEGSLLQYTRDGWHHMRVLR